MKHINFKNFRLFEIKNISPNIFINVEDGEIKKGDNLTISDYLDLKINKGNENLYITIIVYIDEDIEPLKLNIHTKEDQSTLKEIIKEIINQL